MIETKIILSSAGSLSVAVIAFFFFIFQAWIYLKGPAFEWSRRGATLSLATTIFAAAVFVQFNAPPGRINYLAELVQYSSLIILLHSIYGFTFAYLDIKPPRFYRLVPGFHAGLLIVLWTTGLVIADGYVHRDFILLADPYIEPKLGVLGPFLLIYLAAGAFLSLTYWVRSENRKKKRRPDIHFRIFIVGGLGYP